MLKVDTMIIGSGQAGCRLASAYREKFEYDENNVLLFNTASDDAMAKLTLLQEGGQYEGSGRNPLVTLEKIVPPNTSVIKHKIREILNRRVKTVILFNSMGGGSGSAINYHIMKDILIPHTNTPINIVCIIVFPFAAEGNPCNSNALAMLNMYYSLCNDITIIPVENDIAYERGVSNTFDKTNEKISNQINMMINYDNFVGEPKVGGIGTLDKREFSRIIAPSGGFLLYTTLHGKFEADAIESKLSSFGANRGKSMIMLFRTLDNTIVDMSLLNKINGMFPEQLKIIAESRGKSGGMSIDVLTNGVPIPEKFSHRADEVIAKVDELKARREKDKKASRDIIKKGLRSLINI